MSKGSLKNPPNQLRIRDGKLVLADGSAPDEVLKAWAKRNGVGPDDAVNVMERKIFILLTEAVLLASYASR